MDAGFNRYYQVRDNDGEIFTSADRGEARERFEQQPDDEISGELEFVEITDIRIAATS
jgi:hypothetical protein